MAIVGISYRQTIHAYPQGGGSYIVARDNLGTLPGLVAAAALLIDYVLTVAVSVSAGVDALVSAVTGLRAYSVELGVLFIAIIMLINLRGIRESGTIFAAPTYLFIVSFLIMIGAGIVKAAFSPGGIGTPISATTPPEALGWEPQQLGLLLILTAFASGCSAMTGVEAISDGVPAFKAPESRNAARTLTWMLAILMLLFLGITYLAWRFGIEPNAQQVPTVDAQIAARVFSGPFAWFFYVIQIATLFILVLAANTSFADFPRLSSFLARDQFLPHLFAFRGDRLAFSTGIIALAVLSGALLAIFRGRTDALIHLYALGVFTAFTLSQTGMVLRWRRLRDAGGPGWRRSLAINAVGATATAIVALIIGITKFERGAWIVVLLVPLLVTMFRGISRHYAEVAKGTITPTPLAAADIQHIAIVPIPDLNRQVMQSLAYAYSLTPRVVAVHISINPEETNHLRASWGAWIDTRQESWAQLDKVRGITTGQGGRARAQARTEHPRPTGPQLVIIDSPYRSLVAPLVAYIDAVRDQNPAATVSVILPEFVPVHWWERILHNQTALRLKLALYSHPGVVVVNVPYHLPRT
jgi:amino acid transporter